MSEVFPKFIVEFSEEHGLYIIIGKCTYHKELAYDVLNIKGGGSWSLNAEESTFTLFGESYDFGKASFEDIKNCVENKKVFSNYTLNNNFTNKYKFQYKDYVGDIIKLF